MPIEDFPFHQHEIEKMPNLSPQVGGLYTHSPCKQLGDENLQTLLQRSLENSQWGFWNWHLLTDQIECDADWWENLGCVDELPQTRQEFVEKLIHPDDIAIARAAWEKCLRGETRRCEVIYRVLTTTNERKFAIIERGKVSRWDSQHQPIQVMGSQELIEIGQETNNSASDLLDRIRAQIARHGRFDRILRSICSEVRSFLDAERVVIYQLFAHEKNIVTSIANHPTLDLSENIHLPSFPLNDEDIKFYQQGGITIIDNIDQVKINPLQIEYLKQLKVKACAIVPILEYSSRESETLAQQRLWGLIVAQMNPAVSVKELTKLTPAHPNLRQFSPANSWRQISYQWYPQHINALKQVSHLLGIALQKKHLAQHRENAIATLQLTEVREKELQVHLEQVQSELAQYKQKLVDTATFSLLGHLIQAVVNEIYNPINFIYTTLKPVSQNAEDLIRLLELHQTHGNLSPAVITANFPHIDQDSLKTELLKQLWSMRAGSDRLQSIIGALQQFAITDQNQLVKSDIHTGINSSLAILQHRLKAKNQRPGIQVIKDFAQIPQVECYASQLNQVFIHLLNNAIDAIEERLQRDYSFAPTIRIRTAVTRSHLSIISNSQSTNRQYFKNKIAIAISDNGSGILPHIQRQIFSAFFTTKSHPQMQGLGLTTSKYIIEEKHSGKIRCNSQFGQGTEFIVELNPKIN